LLLLLLLCLLAAPFPALAQPIPIRPAYRLPEHSEAIMVGVWYSPERRWTLKTISARRAIVEVHEAKTEKIIDVRFGTYAYERTGWMLTLEDVKGENRKTYGISIRQPDRLSLIDSAGTVIDFKRRE